MSNTLIKITIIAAFIAGSLGVGLFYNQEGKNSTKPGQTNSQDLNRTQVSKKITETKKEKPVINFDSIEKDSSLKKMMDQRKAELGVDRGIDLVVKPDESVKIGGKTLPMKEIIDKIRLEKGELIEDDIIAKESFSTIEGQRKEALQKIEAEIIRYDELENLFKKTENPEKRQAIIEELKSLSVTVEAYKEYKKIIKLLDEQEAVIKKKQGIKAAVRASLESLIASRRKFEARLGIPLLPEETPEVYGIYVALEGDNIWNIHFKFLKDYFKIRGLTLSPLSDEPDKRGASSGVGKLLKFSENIVHIYNIKENRLVMDLNYITPKSKIVIYKMKNVFEVLNQINYRHVNTIQFDGDTLWIPVQQL